MRDATVEEAEAFADDGIACSGEPSCLLLGKGGDVATERVNEESFRELGEHGFAADASGGSLFDELKDGAFEPEPGVVGAKMDFEDGREAIQDGPHDVGVAGHVSADEAGNFAAAAGLQRGEIAGPDLRGDAVVGKWPWCSFAAADVVRVAVGDDDDIAWLELEGGSIDELDAAAAFDDEVIEDEMLGLGCEPGGKGVGWRRGVSPGGGELRREVDCAVQFDSAQNLREGVHAILWLSCKVLWPRCKAIRSCWPIGQ